MRSVCFVLFLLVVVYGDRVLPLPPRDSTEIQKKLYMQKTANATNASKAAIPQVIELLSSETFRNSLDASIANISSKELLDRFVKEVQVSEIISNIASYGNMFDSDKYPVTDLASVVANEYLASEWEALFDGSFDLQNVIRCDDYHSLENLAEISLYSFPAFNNKKNCLPLNFDDAVNRSVYTMLNTLRIDGGNPMFGDIAFVLARNDYAQNRSIVSPLDTGIYFMNCIEDTADDDTTSNFQVNCSAWSEPYMHATLTDFIHMIPISTSFYASQNWLATYFNRVLADDQWGSMQIPLASTILYWEALPLRHAYFDMINGFHSSVRFILASFQTLFGNQNTGSILRQFCIKHKFILVWNHGTSQSNVDPIISTNMSSFQRKKMLLENSQDSPNVSLNGRFLDPYVLQYTNVSANVSHLVATSAALETIQNAWQRAIFLRRNITDIDFAWRLAWRYEFYRLLDELPSQARIQPLRADNCPDIDKCIGTTFADRRCICLD
uniref:Uncharacterized protein n=1 Tax=Aureoumbra lagunensis TaxID=44058 RepID=A0A7S3K4B5_9STRA|mmetsp:Transcript_8980/g.13813  ORF Transcript_8980/g.13813 Transcript_8980/m.13813 type:complete len:497 (-) Transcript_8980:249-1739(-)